MVSLLIQRTFTHPSSL